MISVAVIHENETVWPITFDDLSQKSEFFDQMINNCCEIVQIGSDKDSIFNSLVNTIFPPDTLHNPKQTQDPTKDQTQEPDQASPLEPNSGNSNTIKCFTNYYTTMEICYCTDSGKYGANSLANIMFPKHITSGNVFLVCSTLIDGVTNYQSITTENLKEFIMSQIYFKGIHMSYNKQTNFFEKNTFDYVADNIPDVYDDVDYSLITINLFKMSIHLAIKKNTSLPLNKELTRLCGSRIYGEAYLFLTEQVEDDYFHINCPIKLLEDIITLCYGDIQLDPAEHGDEVRSIMIISTRISLFSMPLGKFVCSGCYRTSYESLDNQKEDWENHKAACQRCRRESNNKI